MHDMRARASGYGYTKYDCQPTLVRQHNRKLAWEFWLRICTVILQHMLKWPKVTESNINYQRLFFYALEIQMIWSNGHHWIVYKVAETNNVRAQSLPGCMHVNYTRLKLLYCTASSACLVSAWLWMSLIRRNLLITGSSWAVYSLSPLFWNASFWMRISYSSWVITITYYTNMLRNVTITLIRIFTWGTHSDANDWIICTRKTYQSSIPFIEKRFEKSSTFVIIWDNQDFMGTHYLKEIDSLNLLGACGLRLGEQNNSQNI